MVLSYTDPVNHIVIINSDKAKPSKPRLLALRGILSLLSDQINLTHSTVILLLKERLYTVLISQLSVEASYEDLVVLLLTVLVS